MSDTVFVWVSVALAAPLLLLALVCVRCNLRRCRAARASAPLDGVDLSEASIRPHRAPPHWPVVERVTDPRVAAAYASYADDKAMSFAWSGEVLTLFGGAVMGAALALYPAVWPLLFVFLLAVVLTVGGIFLRTLSTRRWDGVRLRYRQRYAELTAEPLPAPRRGGLSRLFGR